MSGTATLVIGAIALGMAALIAFVLLLLPNRRVPVNRRRIAEENGTTGLSRMADVATSVVGRFLDGRGDWLNALLDEAGVTTPLKELVIMVGAASLAGFAFGLVIGKWQIGLLLAVLMPVLGRMMLSVLSERRRRQFEAQLDETLQMMAGSLRAGYSLPQSLASIAQEAEPPTSQEFARVTNEMRVGRNLTDALDDVATRMRNEDFYWVTQAIGINREVGGNLAEVLDGVGKTIRQRAELKGQVASLAADGKLSAIILMLLPFVVALFLSLLNPTYIGKLFASPLGWGMLTAGAVMLTIGGVWLNKIIHVKF